MNTWLAFDTPWALWLALAALLPLWRSLHLTSHWPRLDAMMEDPASNTLNVLLRALAALAILSLALTVAGPYRPGGEIARIGTGAHMVLLIDRSSSMNAGFARSAGSDAESKAQAAKRLLQGFAHNRPHDRIGVVGFSTMPMLVVPLTGHPQAVQAAISAIDRPGLAYTDVGRGLAMSLALFGNDSSDAATARVVLLISDGAALIDRRVQEQLRADVAARPVQIYWLFLRSEGSPGIYDDPIDARMDTPQSMPERHLDLFFKSLGVPYRAFEATSAEEVARAIEEVGREQQQPLRYMEPLPRVELRPWALALACLCLLALIAAKLMEVEIRPQETLP